jgi:O-antigen/teichoic acid export membrane protein
VADTTAATITRGARITGAGFALRLLARLPFLVIAYRLYGAADMGRFAYAIMVIELAAHLATLGLKRHLVGALASSGNSHRTASAGMIAGFLGSLIACLVLALFPRLLVPVDLSIPAPIRGVLFLIPLIVVLDLMLVALLHVHELKAQVWSRSIVEPWILLLVATTVAFIAGDAHPLLKSHGLLMGYAASLVAAFAVAAFYYFRHFRLQLPDAVETKSLITHSLPLFASDAIDWAQRRVDIFLLGQIAGATAVGVYYLCQQVATLVQKLRSSFEPVLLPVTAKAVTENNMHLLQQDVQRVQGWLFTVQALLLAVLGIFGGLALTAITGVSAPGLALTLTLLLLAEIFWGAFGIIEVPLVYALPKKNLWIGMAALAVEIIAGFLLIPAFTLAGTSTIGAALTLCLALATGALLRTALAWQHFRLTPPLGRIAVMTVIAASLAALLWWVRQGLFT